MTQHGLAGTVGLALGKLIPSWRTDQPDTFDVAHGTDTGGTIVPDESEVVGGNWAHGVHYRAVDPQDFRDSFTQLRGQLSRYSFVDLGCGKGRALILAWELGFTKVYGVEYSSKLCEIARANCRKTGVNAAIDCADATNARLPAGPLAVFMFNPFDAALLEKVTRRLFEHKVLTGKPIHIVYRNPEHGRVLQRQPWLTEVRSEKCLAVFSSK